MPSEIDDDPVTNLTDLVNAIGKLIAAVFDMHGSIGMANVPSVDIGKS
jgi:hypothetical protein